MIYKLRRIISRDSQYQGRKEAMLIWSKSKDKPIARPDGFYFKKTDPDMTEYRKEYEGLLITNAAVEGSTKKSRPLSKTLSHFSKTADSRGLSRPWSKQSDRTGRSIQRSSLDKMLRKVDYSSDFPKDCELYIFPGDIPRSYA